MMDSTQEQQDHANKKVLVTGASGFVGGHVLEALLEEGWLPVCLVRNAEKLARRLGPERFQEVMVINGDPFQYPALSEAAHDCAAAIHLVGIIEEKPQRGQTFSRVHVEATRNVVNICREKGVTRYLHMSALGTRPEAISKYHQTKWFAEQLVRDSGLEWTIFRPSLIHGHDGEFMQMMKYFVTDRLRQPVMPYFGSGEHLIQPVSVRDVAACFVRALSRPDTAFKTYELGGPEKMSWKTLYDICALTLSGKPRLKMPVPACLAKMAARTVVPMIPDVLMPYKFSADQVQMAEEDNTCDETVAQQTFNLKMRDFRAELTEYAGRIP